MQVSVAASAPGLVSVSGSTQPFAVGLTEGALLTASAGSSLGAPSWAEGDAEAVATGPFTSSGTVSPSPVRASLVPEAGQWMLMLGGVLMMALHLRRRPAGREARPSRY